jgi:DNA end-binding protein Ku
MYYAHEIRTVEEFRTDVGLVKDKEIELAMGLIQALAADFEPQKYHDSYRDSLLAMIEAKKAGQEVVETPQPQPAKVIDILEALKKSLDATKKPAVVETESAHGEVEEIKSRKRAARRANG